MTTEQTPAIPQMLPVPAAAPAVSHARPRHIRLTPGVVTLIAAPVTVTFSMLAGMAILTLANLPLHVAEMSAAAAVNLLGGVLAALALFFMIKKGAAGVAQAGILGIGLRCGAVLVGMIIVSLTAFGLDRIILVYWVMGYYFPMLIVESALVAWLANRVPA